MLGKREERKVGQRPSVDPPDTHGKTAWPEILCVNVLITICCFLKEENMFLKAA